MNRQIGRYEVRSELDHGAFGRVFAAFDPETRRNVAIKVLMIDNDADVLARFSLEVQATAKLKHKNIVTIYDFNKTPPYIVMELVDGESLKHLIARGAPIPLLQKVRIVYQAAEGLGCAHEAGIVHRDVKPANIMVLPNGDVKLLDFGIARITGETEARRTRAGDVIGTMLYMSPERIQGAQADPSSDIFSLGIVCYELITGTHPFAANDFASLIYKVTSEDVPPARLTVPEVPESLDLIIQRATGKDPQLRYQTMDDILFELKPVLLDLEQQRAQCMMLEVQELLAAGKIAEAQERARAVLQLDPANREARRLHQELRREDVRKQVRGKQERLVHEGVAQLEQRQFNKAIPLFESALRLGFDAQAEVLLGRAKAALDANRQASKLFAEAYREYVAGNPDNALQLASDAVKADPQHHEAAAFQEKVRQLIETRERRLRVDSAVRSADDRLSEGDIEGARAALAELPMDANTERLRDLRARIESAEAERARRLLEERLQSGLRVAKQQANLNQLSEAEATVRALLEEFPNDTSAYRLLETVQQRARAIADGADQARRHLQAREFAAARELLERALNVYGAEARLEELLAKAIASERSELERQGELARRRAAIERALDAGDLSQADEELLSAKNAFPGESGFEDLDQRLRDSRKREYDAQVQRAEDLARRGAYNDAESLLRKVLQDNPADTRATVLARTVSVERLRAERQRRLEAEKAQVRDLLASRDFQQALRTIEGLEVEFRGDPDLPELRKTAERQSEVQGSIARFEQLEAGGEFQTALEMAEKALAIEPDNADVIAACARLRRSALDLLVKNVRSFVAHRDLPGARSLLDGSAKRWASQPEWQGLDREVNDLLAREAARRQVEESIRQGRRRAEERKAAGDLAGALQELDDLRRQHPDDAGLAKDRAVLARAVEVDFANRALSRVAALQSEQRWDEAREEAERALAAYPQNGALSAAAEDARRRAEIAALSRAIREAIAARDWRAADEKIESAKARFPADRSFDGFAEEARTGRLEQEMRELTSAVEGALLDGNLDEAERLLGQNGRTEEQAWRDLRRQVDVHRKHTATLQESEELRRAGEYGRAEALLAPLLDDALDARASALLLSIRAERRQSERNAAIQATIQQVQKLAEVNLPGALGLLDRACREYTDDPALGRLRKELQVRADQEREQAQRVEAERKKAAERARRIDACRSAVDAAAARSDWERAFAEIEEAERQLPRDLAWTAIRQQLQRRKNEAVRQELTRAVQESLAAGDLDEAARKLAAAPVETSENPVLKGFEEEIARRRQYNEMYEEGQELVIRSKYEEARSKLREAIALNVADTRANALLKAIEEDEIVRLRFRTRLGLAIRKLRPVLWRAAIAGIVIALGIFGWQFWRSKPAVPNTVEVPVLTVPPISLKCRPPELKFSYRLGGPELPQGVLDFDPVDLDFRITADDDWLVVTPDSGKRLGRLQVRITKAPSVGIFSARLWVRTQGRPIANAPVSIPVQLEVIGAATIPPVPLRLDRYKLTFDYTINGELPQVQTVNALEGSIRDATASAEWIRPVHLTRKVTVGFSASELARLAPGNQSGIVTVTPSDQRTAIVIVTVLLRVRPAPQVARPPETADRKVPEEKKEEVKPQPAPQPPPQPPPPGCTTGPFGGVTDGMFNWTGVLPPGQSVTIRNRERSTGIVNGPVPTDNRAVVATVEEAGIEVVQSPTLQNQCLPLVFRNKGSAPIRFFTVVWRISLQK